VEAVREYWQQTAEGSVTAPTGNPRGRPPVLTDEQSAEVYEAVHVRRRLTNARLMERYGCSAQSLLTAVRRERERRHA